MRALRIYSTSRKNCTSCKCPREAHDVCHEEWVSVRSRLGLKGDESSGPIGVDPREKGLAWAPPGLPSHKVFSFPPSFHILKILLNIVRKIVDFNSIQQMSYYETNILLAFTSNKSIGKRKNLYESYETFSSLIRPYLSYPNLLDVSERLCVRRHSRLREVQRAAVNL